MGILIHTDELADEDVSRLTEGFDDFQEGIVMMSRLLAAPIGINKEGLDKWFEEIKGFYKNLENRARGKFPNESVDRHFIYTYKLIDFLKGVMVEKSKDADVKVEIYITSGGDAEG